MMMIDCLTAGLLDGSSDHFFSIID